MSHGPIFIAGLERSGTSLIFALLASHPNIAMTRRTNLWTHFYGQYGDLADDANLDRCLDMMMRYRRLQVLEPDRDELRARVPERSANVRGALRATRGAVRRPTRKAAVG